MACEAEQAILEMRQAEEAVAYAYMIVENAEATLASMEYSLAQGRTTLAMMMLWYCQYGGGGMAMAKPAETERPDIAAQRDAVKRFKAIHIQKTRQRDELLGM